MMSSQEARHSVQLQLLLLLVAELAFCAVLLLGASGCTLGDLDLHARDMSIGDKDSSRKAAIPVAEKLVLP